MKAPHKYAYWINSSKFSALNKVSNLIFNLISFILLARLLEPTAFGVWGLFITISATIYTARVSLIRSAFIRFMNQAGKDEHRNLQASALAISLCISLFFSLAFLLLAPHIAVWLNAPGLDTILYWYSFTMLINTIASQCEMSLTATANFKAVSYMYLARQGFMFLVIVIHWVFSLDFTPTTLSVYYLFSIVASTLTGLYLARSILQLTLDNYRKWLPELWKFGRFVFGTNISAQLFRSGDSFITSAMISPAVSAFYSASNRISNLIDMPSNILADVAFNKAAQLDNQNKASVKNMYEKTTGAILVFSFPALIIILLFPELILRILAGQAFVGAAPILRITAFFGFVLPFLKQYGTIMDATGYPQINFRTNLLSCVLNIIFNVVCITYFGFIGAAVGTAITYFCTFCITQRILYRKFGISFLQVLTNTFNFYVLFIGIGRRYVTGRPVIKAR
jgi:O-antigen/teichoic acid export membrane protein